MFYLLAEIEISSRLKVSAKFIISCYLKDDMVKLKRVFLKSINILTEHSNI